MSLQKTLKEIAKKRWENSAERFADLENIEITRISTGLPSLDRIIGWGIPEGRIFEIFWPSSSGKTSLAIKFLAEVQKARPDKKVAYIDVEQALDPVYAQVLGLDMDEVIFSQPWSAEEALDIIDKLANSNEISAIVLDSVAQLVPKKELEGEIGSSEMGMRARLLGQFFRKVTEKLNKKNCTLFCINQVRQNIGQTYGNPETTPWGWALTFASSVRIRTSIKKVDDKSWETTMKILKNKVGKPFGETTVRIGYGYGYDVIQDIITVAKTLKVVTRAGAYYSFGEKKRMGEEPMRKELSEDKTLFETLKNEVLKAPEVEKEKEDNAFTLDEIVADVI